MRILNLQEIRSTLVYPEIIDCMRAALIAHARGECATPMPMHLEIPAARAELHIKSSYRQAGRFFALKVAGTFPGNLARGISTSSGMVLLGSAETGEPVAILADDGHLTDVRTAAVAAMVARELGRRDRALGILGTGVQARLEARMHAEVLPLERIFIWGRTPERCEECRADLARLLPGCRISMAASPAEVAGHCRLIVTATASRAPLLRLAELLPGTHISAVGADSPGKQELDPEILCRAALLLVDSLSQCEKLGELQHALARSPDAVGMGAFCMAPDRAREIPLSVADFTGLGVEDLYIAEYAWQRSLS